MKQDTSQEQIIESLKSKDRRVIQEIYEKYSPTLLAISMRYFRRRDIALDVMHEGFMKALNAISSFNDEGSFEGWLKRIVVYHALDVLKKEKKHEFSEIGEIEPFEEERETEKTIDRKDVNEDKVDVNLVRDADFTSREILEEIYSLPQMYCVVFVLFVLEEFSHAEIAEQLGIDENASRTRLRRARQMVKEALYKKSIKVLSR